MNRLLILCAVVAVALYASFPAAAEAHTDTCSWNGRTAARLWNQKDNWDSCDGEPPQPHDKVQIGSGDAYPRIDSSVGSVTIQNLDLQDATLFVDVGVQLTVNGTITVQGAKLENDGTINGTINLVSGELKARGTLGGPITVQPLATLQVPAGAVLASAGDITVQPLGTVDADIATLGFHGSTFTNNGTVKGQIRFSRSGTQTIAGTGKWNGAKIVVEGGSTAALANSMTLQLSALNLATNSTLDLGQQTLTLSGPTQVGLTSSTVSGGGKLLTQGDVKISNSTRFTPTLEVGTGTTTINGTVAGPISVSRGATLTVTAGGVLAVKNNITNSGVITGSTLLLEAPTFQNDGNVLGPLVRFIGHAQTLKGSGSFSSTNTVTVGGGTTLGLGSNHQLGKLTIYAGGRMNLNERTLSLSGAGNPLLNQNVLTTSGSTIVYNAKVSQTVQTNRVDYYGLTIDNTAGVTLPASKVVSTTLTLKNGTFNIGGYLRMAKLSTIAREYGKLNGTPIFAGKVNVEYNGAGDVTTGTEIPTPALALNNLTVNRVGGVSLGASPTVNGILNLAWGDLKTKGFIMNLARTATFEGNFEVVGQVRHNGPLAAGVAYSLNNRFTTIKFAPLGTLPSSVIVNLAKSAPTNFTTAVKRTYVVTVAGGSGYSATWRMHYEDGELNGNPESTLRMWRFKPATLKWEAYPPTSRNTTDNWVERAGVKAFSTWTLAR